MLKRRPFSKDGRHDWLIHYNPDLIKRTIVGAKERVIRTFKINSTEMNYKTLQTIIISNVYRGGKKQRKPKAHKKMI